MGNGRSRLNFEVGTATGDKTLRAVVPVDMFLAAGVTDGEGKTSNRLVFRFKGSKQFYFLFPKGTEESMRPAAGWLQELLEREVGAHEDGGAPIPDDLVSDVPVGDPLEA